MYQFWLDVLLTCQMMLNYMQHELVFLTLSRSACLHITVLLVQLKLLADVYLFCVRAPLLTCGLLVCRLGLQIVFFNGECLVTFDNWPYLKLTKKAL